MCKEEIMNKEDRKEWKKMDKQADLINRALVGKLAPTTEEWLRSQTKLS